MRWIFWAMSLMLVACATGQSGQQRSGNEGLRLAAPELANLDEADIGLFARIHYATHTPDFDRSRAFYRALGYTEGVTGFPLTNTHAMARALGMFDVCQYELAKGEVMNLPGSPNPSSIDLLQFKTPFDGSPPYELPNHLGAAYAVFATADFGGDMQRLEQIGAQLLSAPMGEAGQRAVFFRDVDGVLYLLQEAPGEVVDGRTMQIFDMPYLTINVSDLDASLEFYQRLGYVASGAMQSVEGDEAAAALFGLSVPYQRRYVDIVVRRGDQHRLRLQQWIAPFDPEPAYPPPINRIGINRIAVLVTDLDRAVRILKAQGVPFLSEPASCCSGTGEDESGIVHVIDPDGVFVELVGRMAPAPLEPQPEGCPPLEIKYPPPAG